MHLVALYLPGDPQPTGPDYPGLDKAVHVVLFAVPVLLLSRWLALCGAARPRAWAAGVLGVHGVVSEVLQHLVVPHRTGSLADLAADGIGIGLGVMLAARWRIGGVGEAGVCCHGAVRREPHDTGL